MQVVLIQGDWKWRIMKAVTILTWYAIEGGIVITLDLRYPPLFGCSFSSLTVRCSRRDSRVLVVMMRLIFS